MAARLDDIIGLVRQLHIAGGVDGGDGMLDESGNRQWRVLHQFRHELVSLMVLDGGKVLPARRRRHGRRPPVPKAFQ